MFVRLFHHKMIPPPLVSKLYPFERSHCVQPALKSGELHSLSLRVDYQYILFGILLHDRFVFSLPFINLLNHLHISIQSSTTLFCCSNCSSFGHWEFQGIYFPFLTFMSQHAYSTNTECLLCAMPCANHIRPICSLVYKGRE